MMGCSKLLRKNATFVLGRFLLGALKLYDTHFAKKQPLR